MLIEKEVVAVKLDRAVPSKVVYKNIQAGKIVGVVAYVIPLVDKINGLVERIFINIKNENSQDMVKLQPIQNLRSREAAYQDSFLPIMANGGQEISIEVSTKVNFANEDVDISVIFIYDEPLNKMC